MNAAHTSSDRPNQAVTLVRVASPREEAEVLGALGTISARAETPVVPVLDQGGLPERLSRLLSAAGCEVRSITLDSVPQGGTRAAASGRPAAVFFSDGVPASVSTLAAGLCGVEPRPLSEAEGALGTALVLINPAVAGVGDVSAAMARLTSAGTSVGILYTIDPIESRLAVLKSLILGSINGHGRYSVLTSHREAGPEGAPASLQVASEAEGRLRFSRPQDLLLIGGHANALDAMLGPKAGLCARAKSGLAQSSEGVFPCFTDGKCFRQPMMGRAAEDRDGLVSIEESQASIVVLSGCSVAALGKSWFSTPHGLAYQTQQAAGLAAAVTGSVTLARLELDVLFLALIAEGRPMGEVVAEINRVRTAAHDHAKCYSDQVGPFFLLGNPCLRIEGFHVQEVTPVVESERSISIPLSGVRFDSELGALVRVPVAPSAKPPLMFLRARPEDIWCRGVFYPGDTAACLYLWIGHGDQATEDRLQIDLCHEDPSAVVGNAVVQCLHQLSYWMVALDYYRSYWGQGAQNVEATLPKLPEAVRELSRAVAALAAPPGVLVDASQTRSLAHAAWERLGSLSETLLRCLADIVCRFGTLPLAGWEENFLRLDARGPLDPCACGSPVWGQRYRFPGNPSLERCNYQCPVCGPIGEDDCRRLLRVTELPRKVARGTLLTARAYCRGPANEAVRLVAVLCIESLFKDRRMVGDLSSEAVNPGEEKTISVSVLVPEDLTPGVYPVALLAVVNGASYVFRQLIQVNDSSGT